MSLECERIASIFQVVPALSMFTINLISRSVEHLQHIRPSLTDIPENILFSSFRIVTNCETVPHFNASSRTRRVTCLITHWYILNKSVANNLSRGHQPIISGAYKCKCLTWITSVLKRYLQSREDIWSSFFFMGACQPMYFTNEMCKRIDFIIGGFT